MPLNRTYFYNKKPPSSFLVGSPAVINRPLSRYSCSAKVWSKTWIKHTTGKNKPSLVSALIFWVTDQTTMKCHHFENCDFYKVLYGERARHAKPYNNRNFQIDGASYFGVRVWQLVYLLILVCSFQWRVLFLCLAKLYRSCPIRDKGLLTSGFHQEATWPQNSLI